MTLFDILSHDERVIVLSDVSSDNVYTWNQSLTLQLWHCSDYVWREIDVRTLSEEPKDFEAARMKAIYWKASQE